MNKYMMLSSQHLQVKLSTGRDYIYYRWLHKFPHANAMAVFKVYHEFLTKVTKSKSDPSANEATKDDESSEDDDVAWSAPAATPKKKPFAVIYEEAKKMALVALTELEKESTWRSPPQDEVPEIFLCALSSGVMKVPSFSRKNPDMRRIEK